MAWLVGSLYIAMPLTISESVMDPLARLHDHLPRRVVDAHVLEKAEAVARHYQLDAPRDDLVHGSGTEGRLHHFAEEPARGGVETSHRFDSFCGRLEDARRV